ncbi:YkvA family protein [Halomonas sp. PA16-9]|uniref:YkvA family protein n=1 Tax=Halomonas sp. PA16-9 TaxID=2576841 RepID=UPI0030EC4D15
MTRDVMRGDFRPIPWSAFGMMALALGYLVLPFDLIPDFLMLIGVVDDVLIVAGCSIVSISAWKAIGPEIYRSRYDAFLTPAACYPQWLLDQGCLKNRCLSPYLLHETILSHCMYTQRDATQRD